MGLTSMISDIANNPIAIGLFGEAIRKLRVLISVLTFEDMLNHIEFL